MTSYTNIEKRIWDDTPAGKLEEKIKRLHNKLYDSKKLTPEIERWIDIHRAQTMSKERDITDEFVKAGQKLEEDYREKWQGFMCEQYQKELDHLTQFV